MDCRKRSSPIGDSLGALVALCLCGLITGCASLRTDDSARDHVHLKVSAIIDGSDRLIIMRDAALWEHLSWSLPTNVKVNGIPWSLNESFVLRNSGETKFLPPNVDFSTAKVESRHGRDLVGMETETDKIIIFFGDNPNGAAPYDIDIVFDQK